MLKKAGIVAVMLLAVAAVQAQDEKVLRLPMRAGGPGSLDPVTGSTVYDNRAASTVYETLVQYKFLKRPRALEPLLLEEMPTSSADGLTWSFKLKQGIRFQDDPCFPDGKGREMVVADVFYSWKRLADKRYEFENWWIFKDTIQGFDAYKEEQAARVDAGGDHDYDAPVEGLRLIDDYNFEVVLTEPVYRFIWTLAQFQTSIVPHEAVALYGDRFSRHPVGSGAFMLEEWTTNKSLTYVRNPNFHTEYFPTEWEPGDEELGFTYGAGKTLPFVDRVEIKIYIQENPMWLQFLAGELDYTQVPAENHLEAFHKRSGKLKKEFREKGVIGYPVPLLDFIFRGFNMEDELVGGYDEKHRHLRKAIALSIDLEEFNDVFYNSTNIVYDGMIPPGLDGYPEDGRGPISWTGVDLDLAKEHLAKAGYPDGEGLPVIDYFVSRSGNIPEQAELLKRQLAKTGIRINVRTNTFAQLIEAINNRKAPMFSFAWSSDYPDGENNLALFYGPNECPGSNHYNYKNAEFDELYEKIRTMAPSPERTAIYAEMRDMVMADVAFVGAMARTRAYVIQPWLKNYKPIEGFGNWIKYMDVDESARRP